MAETKELEANGWKISIQGKEEFDFCLVKKESEAFDDSAVLSKLHLGLDELHNLYCRVGRLLKHYSKDGVDPNTGTDLPERCDTCNGGVNSLYELRGEYGEYHFDKVVQNYCRECGRKLGVDNG
jgi:hypothetical protein